MSHGFHPPQNKGAVSVGIGVCEGKDEKVLLSTGGTSQSAVFMTTECARFLGLQLIQWADYLDKSKQADKGAE
jgi:hypothetical protein